MSETVIRSRIGKAVKEEAQALLARFGLNMSEAIRLFLHQVVLEKGLPFKVNLPGEQAREHDRWFREQVEKAVTEADQPETEFIPQPTVHRHWASKRKALLKQAGNPPT